MSNKLPMKDVWERMIVAEVMKDLNFYRTLLLISWFQLVCNNNNKKPLDSGAGMIISNLSSSAITVIYPKLYNKPIA